MGVGFQGIPQPPCASAGTVLLSLKTCAGCCWRSLPAPASPCLHAEGLQGHRDARQLGGFSLPTKPHAGVWEQEVCAGSPRGGISARLSETQGICRDVLLSSCISLVLQMPLVPALLRLCALSALVSWVLEVRISLKPVLDVS